jgi:PAS domain S-box-containing protein
MGARQLQRATSHRGFLFRHHLAAALSCVIFLSVDVFSPISAAGALYVVVLYWISRLNQGHLVLLYALVTTILSLAGGLDWSQLTYDFSPDRVISILLIWGAAWFFYSAASRKNSDPLPAEHSGDSRWLEMAFDLAPNPMVMVDTDGVIQLANKPAQTLFGYQQNELVGQKIECLIPERYRKHHVELRDEYINAPSKRNMGEGRDLFGIHKDGTEIPLEIGLNPVKTWTGPVVISSIVDISDRVEQLNKQKKLSRKLFLANQYLEKTNKELDDFVYVASHDLRSPLRGIEQLADFIEEDAGDLLPKNSHDDLNLLRDRVKRMENLLASLLAYSRIGRKEGEAGWIDPKSVLEDVLELYVPAERFQVNLPEHMPQIYAPRAAVELVFRNLFMNAVKHHDKDRGVIDVEMETNENEVIYMVADDGPGVPEKYQEKIFQLFQTLKPRDELEGSGMGLALVRKTMEIHDGWVEVQSDGQRGTRFVLGWPVPRDAPPE